MAWIAAFEGDQDLLLHVRNEPRSPVRSSHQCGNARPRLPGFRVPRELGRNSNPYAPSVLGVDVIDDDGRVDASGAASSFPRLDSRPDPCPNRSLFGPGAMKFPSMRPVWMPSPRRRVSFYMAVFLVFIPVLFELVGPIRLTVRTRYARHHLLSVSACDAEHPMLHAPPSGQDEPAADEAPHLSGRSA